MCARAACATSTKHDHNKRQRWAITGPTVTRKAHHAGEQAGSDTRKHRQPALAWPPLGFLIKRQHTLLHCLSRPTLRFSATCNQIWSELGQRLRESSVFAPPQTRGKPRLHFTVYEVLPIITMLPDFFSNTRNKKQQKLIPGEKATIYLE